MRALLALSLAALLSASAAARSLENELLLCPCVGTASNWARDTRFKAVWRLDDPKPSCVGDTCRLQDLTGGGHVLGAVTGSFSDATKNGHREGCRALHTTVNSHYCFAAYGCIAADLCITTGDLAIGAWVNIDATPTAVNRNYWFGTDQLEGTFGSGTLMAYNDVNKLLFITDFDAAAAENVLTSTATYTPDTWIHHVGRIRSGTKEQLFNGILDATTTPGIAPQSCYGNGTGLANHSYNFKSWLGLIDDAWVFAGTLADNDVCRIATCGVAGCGCTCDPATPANYLAAPLHTSFGGPLTCTLPACDKAAPTANPTTTTTSTTTTTTL